MDRQRGRLSRLGQPGRSGDVAASARCSPGGGSAECPCSIVAGQAAADEVAQVALLRYGFPEQRKSMIWVPCWVQMASARSSNATRSLWLLGTLVAMS